MSLQCHLQKEKELVIEECSKVSTLTAQVEKAGIEHAKEVETLKKEISDQACFI